MATLANDMNASLDFLMDTLDELVDHLNDLGESFMDLNEEFMGANNYTMSEYEPTYALYQSHGYTLCGPRYIVDPTTMARCAKILFL